MNSSEISEKIRAIIAGCTDFPAGELVSRTSEMLGKDLGIDSLTLLDIALSIDQEFDTEFTEEELFKMQSIDIATSMVEERLLSKS
jgi:acyl carrier protein